MTRTRQQITPFVFFLAAFLSYEPAVGQAETFDDGNRNLPWVSVRNPADQEALSAAIAAAINSEGSLREEAGERDAYLRETDREVLAWSRALYRHRNGYRQAAAKAAEAAGRLMQQRKEKRYLQQRFAELKADYVKKNETSNRIKELARLADRTLSSRLSHVRHHVLVRGIVDVPVSCIDKKPGAAAAFFQQVSAKAVDDARSELSLESLSDEETPVAYRAVLEDIDSRLTLVARPASKPVEKLYEPADEDPDAEPEGTEPAADTAAAPHYTVVFAGLLELHMTETPGAENGAGDATSTSGACDPSSLQVRVSNVYRWPHQVEWPSDWRLGERLDERALVQLTAEVEDLVGTWESLEADGVDAPVYSAWMTEWRATRDWLAAEMESLRAQQDIIKPRLADLGDRLSGANAMVVTQELLDQAVKAAGKRRNALVAHLASGKLASIERITFSLSPSASSADIEAAAKGKTLLEVQRALEQARQSHAARIRDFQESATADGMIAAPEDYAVLFYSAEPTKGTHALDVALRVRAEARSKTFDVPPIFSFDERRNLAEFLPSADQPEHIVHQLIWRVPQDSEQNTDWNEAAAIAQDLSLLPGCSQWRLPYFEELRAISYPSAEHCTLFPELGIDCDDQVWTVEPMGRSDYYRTLILTRSSDPGATPREEPADRSTSLKFLLVCEPDWKELDRVPELPDLT